MSTSVPEIAVERKPPMPPELQSRVAALFEARRLVSFGWTKGAFARDHADRVVAYNNPTAECFCLEAAIVVGGELMDLSAEDEKKTLDLVRHELGDDLSIAAFNDDIYTSIVDILFILDCAINRACGREDLIRQQGRIHFVGSALASLGSGPPRSV